MTSAQITALAACGQLAFVALDLAFRRRRGAAPLGGTGRGYLLGFVALFGAVQVAGLLAVPRNHAVLDAARAGAAALSGRPPEPAPIPPAAAAAVAVAAFYLAGLWDYLIHRFFSHHPRFFFTHEYHHLPTQVFMGLPGILTRPFAVLTVFPTTVLTAASLHLGLVAAGAPLWDLRALGLLLLLWAAIGSSNHSEALRASPALNRAFEALLFTSPREHVLHHARDLRGNYGNFTTLWDRVFGTYLDPADPAHRDVPLGLGYDRDYLQTLTAGRLRLSDATRAKAEIGRFCRLDRGASGPAG